MNGGVAAHIIRQHAKEANGHAAWQALIVWYEGTIMSGEIAKGIRTKLWNLRLHPRGEANKFINNFTQYADQFKELEREERDKTLISGFNLRSSI